MQHTYETGLWSNRDGALLTWGKDDKKQSNRFGPDDKIIDVPAGYHDAIHKSGYTPEDFCFAGSVIAARILTPEIKECIAFARREIEQKQAEAKADLDNAITKGIAFRAAEIPAQYDATLCWARRLTDAEKPEYSEWFRDLCMTSFSGGDHIKVEKDAIRQVIGKRKSDGQFCGCTNSAWTVNDDEWDQIVKLSAQISAQKDIARTTFAAQEAADIQRKKDTGYCFSCESYCHGDCGHYSNDPVIKNRRDLVELQRESRYGIDDDA